MVNFIILLVIIIYVLVDYILPIENVQIAGSAVVVIINNNDNDRVKCQIYWCNTMIINNY